MSSTGRTAYAPRTRGGLLLSCGGFAGLAATALIPALTEPPGPMTGLGFVVSVLVTAFVPRLIPVGSSWWRVALPRTCASVVFVISGSAALFAVTVQGSAVPVVASIVVICAAMIAVSVRAPDSSESAGV